MKKQKLFPAVLAAALFSALAFAEENTLFIFNSEGNASIVRSRRTLPIELDMPLQKDDVLRVEADSYLDLVLNRVGGARLGGPAECQIAAASPSNMRLNMKSGSFLVNLKTLPSGGVFEIETPDAVVSANDSQYYLQSGLPGKPNSLYVCKKGRIIVHLKKASANITVLENQTLEFAPDAYLPATRQMNEEEEKLTARVRSVYAGEVIPESSE